MHDIKISIPCFLEIENPALVPDAGIPANLMTYNELKDNRGHMNIEQPIKEKRNEILSIAARNGAYNVHLFGSVVRGEATDKSDIDFLVDMQSGRSLLDVAGLMIDLEKLLGRKVDIVTTRGLKPLLRADVLNEARTL